MEKEIFALFEEDTLYYFKVRCIKCGEAKLLITNTLYPATECDTCGTVEIPTCENFIKKETI